MDIKNRKDRPRAGNGLGVYIKGFLMTTLLDGYDIVDGTVLLYIRLYVQKVCHLIVVAYSPLPININSCCEFFDDFLSPVIPLYDSAVIMEDPNVSKLFESSGRLLEHMILFSR